MVRLSVISRNRELVRHVVPFLNNDGMPFMSGVTKRNSSLTTIGKFAGLVTGAFAKRKLRRESQTGSIPVTSVTNIN